MEIDEHELSNKSLYQTSNPYGFPLHRAAETWTAGQAQRRQARLPVPVRVPRALVETKPPETMGFTIGTLKVSLTGWWFQMVNMNNLWIIYG